jgi:pimeloyl-ACP methyl ester carboxylesterase
MWDFLETKAWDDGTWYASSCANTEGNAEIGRFLGTPFVVRDMVRIIDALEEDGLLRFWGRSYSTVLGQTFAAMFPDRIDRMLLDSNVRANDYYDGSWLTATAGTEKSLENWLENCISAGPELCPGIANFTGPETKVQDIMNALSDVFQELENDPIVPPESYPGYSSFFWFRPGGFPILLEAKYRILQYLYRPDQASILALVLTTILNKDWEAWIGPPVEANATTPTDVELPWQYAYNNVHGIGCSDSKFRASKPEDLYSMIAAQSKQGSFADTFSPQFWPCAQWPFKAAEQFDGKFVDINTSYPILFVNSAFDPITPINQAWEVASGFRGSVLLTHKGHGVSTYSFDTWYRSWN